jgi:hypothetical protein
VRAANSLSGFPQRARDRVTAHVSGACRRVTSAAEFASALVAILSSSQRMVRTTHHSSLPFC